MSRFASAASYIRAGNAAADSAVRMQQAVRSASPDYHKSSQQQLDLQGRRAAKTAQAEAGVAANRRAEDAKTYHAKTEIEVDKARIDAKKAKRKAGLVATAASLGSKLLKNPKEEKINESLYPSLDPMRARLASRRAQLNKDLEDVYADVDVKAEALKRSVNDDGTPASKTESPATPSSPSSTVSTFKPNEAERKLMDYVASGESGRWGYDAMNQGTDASGNIVGSGAFSQILGGGTKLTDKTIAEVIQQQSGYDDKSITDAQWRAQGGLWAAGKYQFIGPTLKNEVAAMGLDVNQKFSPEIQDKIYLHHLKRVGSFEPWEAVNRDPNRHKYLPLISQIRDFS